MSPSNICIFCTKIKAFFMCHFFVNPNPDTKVKKNLQETNKTRKKTSTREETKKYTLRRKEFLLGLSLGNRYRCLKLAAQSPSQCWQVFFSGKLEGVKLCLHWLRETTWWDTGDVTENFGVSFVFVFFWFALICFSLCFVTWLKVCEVDYVCYVFFSGLC